MRCIGASATAEDETEEQNQQSPAMLKKQRKYLLDPSGEEDADLQAQTAHDKPVGGGKAAAYRKADDASAEMDWPIDAELFGVAEIAEMATLLLQMILELCGMVRNMLSFSPRGICVIAKGILCMSPYIALKGLDDSRLLILLHNCTDVLCVAWAGSLLPMLLHMPARPHVLLLLTCTQTKSISMA